MRDNSPREMPRFRSYLGTFSRGEASSRALDGGDVAAQAKGGFNV